LLLLRQAVAEAYGIRVAPDGPLALTGLEQLPWLGLEGHRLGPVMVGAGSALYCCHDCGQCYRVTFRFGAAMVETSLKKPAAAPAPLSASSSRGPSLATCRSPCSAERDGLTTIV
jgi:hypothetical protein